MRDRHRRKGYRFIGMDVLLPTSAIDRSAG
jgi:hypothetical protein